MKTITLPLEEYECLIEKIRAIDNGKIHISYSPLGMGCYKYELTGVHDDTKKIIQIMNEECDRIRREYSSYRQSIESKKEEVNKKHWFFKW